jgi:hypothetical protein
MTNDRKLGVEAREFPSSLEASSPPNTIIVGSIVEIKTSFNLLCHIIFVGGGTFSPFERK